MKPTGGTAYGLLNCSFLLVPLIWINVLLINKSIRPSLNKPFHFYRDALPCLIFALQPLKPNLILFRLILSKDFWSEKEGRKKIWLSEGRRPPAFAGIATRTSFGKKRLCRLIRLGIVLWPENPCLQSYVEPIQLIRKLEPSVTFSLFCACKPISFPNISRNQHLFNFRI